MVSNGGLESYDLNSAPSILFPENPFNPRQYNYGNADYDVTHYVSMNWVWDNSLRHIFHWGPNAIFGGWTLGGTVFYRTGLPFTVIDTNASLAGFNDGGTIFAQQLTPGAFECGKSAVNGPCFSPSMFTDPATGWRHKAGISSADRAT